MSSHKNRVRAYANRALTKGTLKQQPCEVCGDEDSEMHHEDYDKPLEVKWLCLTHHRKRHREMYIERRRVRHREYERVRRLNG